LGFENVMSTTDLELTAHSIVANGKGILAADETPGKLTRRFSAHGIPSTPDSQQPEAKPWTLTFSYGRALQNEALTAWGGRDANLTAAQRAFYHRARCDFAAAHGRYSTGIEAGQAAA
jgi:fructose-bisphosphate aldolase class 1